MRILLAIPLVAVPAAAQFRMVEMATVDLSATASPASPSYIGSHPAAVHWDGSTLHVAGQSDGSASGVGIVRITNALETPSFGAQFAFVTGTPAGLGYTGIDASFNVVSAAYDHGAVHPQGLQAWAASFGPFQFWALAAQGVCGAAVDPGWSGNDRGVAWLPIGSERRALQELASGTTIYSSADGMVVSPGGSAPWRDLAFDKVTGDVYARRGNDVVRALRTGGNACTPSLIVDLADADTVPGQHVEILGSFFGKHVIYNDRTSTAPGQPFENVVKVATSAGTPIAVSWVGTPMLPGAGQYDFSYAQAGESVAVLDTWNRRVTIYQFGPVPSTARSCFGDGTGAPCPCGNSGASGNGCANSVSSGGGRLDVSGVPDMSEDTLVLNGSGMPDSTALYFSGSAAIAGGAGAAFGDGLRCAGGTVVRIGTETNVGGASQRPGPGDPPLSHSLWPYPGPRVYQVWYRNPADYCTSATFNLTNAVDVVWGL